MKRLPQDTQAKSCWHPLYSVIIQLVVGDLKAHSVPGPQLWAAPSFPQCIALQKHWYTLTTQASIKLFWFCFICLLTVFCGLYNLPFFSRWIHYKITAGIAGRSLRRSEWNYYWYHNLIHSVSFFIISASAFNRRVHFRDHFVNCDVFPRLLYLTGASDDFWKHTSNCLFTGSALFPPTNRVHFIWSDIRTANPASVLHLDHRFIHLQYSSILY